MNDAGMLVTEEMESVLTSCASPDSGDAHWTGWRSKTITRFIFNSEMQGPNASCKFHTNGVFVCYATISNDVSLGSYPWSRKLKVEFFREWQITKL